MTACLLLTYINSETLGEHQGLLSFGVVKMLINLHKNFICIIPISGGVPSYLLVYVSYSYSVLSYY